jgi:hypothetical protein
MSFVKQLKLCCCCNTCGEFGNQKDAVEIIGRMAWSNVILKTGIGKILTNMLIKYMIMVQILFAIHRCTLHLGDGLGWRWKKHLSDGWHWIWSSVFFMVLQSSVIAEEGRRRACFCGLEWSSWLPVCDIISREILRLRCILSNWTDLVWREVVWVAGLWADSLSLNSSHWHQTMSITTTAVPVPASRREQNAIQHGIFSESVFFSSKIFLCGVHFSNM